MSNQTFTILSIVSTYLPINLSYEFIYTSTYFVNRKYNLYSALEH